DGEMLDWLLAHESHSELAARVPAEDHARFVQTVRDNIVMPVDAAELAKALYSDAGFHSDAALNVLREAGDGFYKAALDELDGAEDFKTFAKATGQAAGVKGKGLFMPLRAAITGLTHGPEMARVWDLLGKDVIGERLASAQRHAAKQD
ncbi:MAG: glutamate--tRNA ligase, partial [Gammaproteobacteria bacterium]|nr:glutamate--tRNA ligase [Gammaproteobacteria bacterium]